MLAPAANPINLAIVGTGNCASSLVQGLTHYGEGLNDPIGLTRYEMDRYRPHDIRVVAAWDIDRRKVGQDVASAIFARPNCTTRFCEAVADTGTLVEMGRLLDGVADRSEEHTSDRTFAPAELPEPSEDEVTERLRYARVDVLDKYPPKSEERRGGE